MTDRRLLGKKTNPKIQRHFRVFVEAMESGFSMREAGIIADDAASVFEVDEEENLVPVKPEGEEQ